MSVSELSRKAEAAAKVYLEMRGYTIIEQNFRRPGVQIDIIATKANIAYLVQVKYLRSGYADGPLESITTARLRQIRRAAAIWAEEYKWRDKLQLAVVEITGDNFVVMNFNDNAF